MLKVGFKFAYLHEKVWKINQYFFCSDKYTVLMIYWLSLGLKLHK